MQAETSELLSAYPKTISRYGASLRFIGFSDRLLIPITP
jgi:hypothetical protein